MYYNYTQWFVIFFLDIQTGNGIILVSFSRNPSSKIIKDHSWLSSNNDWMNVFFSTVTGLIQVMSWFQCQACTFCPTYRMTLTLFFFRFARKRKKIVYVPFNFTEACQLHFWCSICIIMAKNLPKCNSNFHILIPN